MCVTQTQWQWAFPRGLKPLVITHIFPAVITAELMRYGERSYGNSRSGSFFRPNGPTELSPTATDFG